MEADLAIGPLMQEARAALKAGQAQRACDMLRERQSDGWNDGQYLELMGAACCLAGCPADGVSALERALALTPSAHAHFNLGRACQMAGMVQRAQACYEHALALDPTYQNALDALKALAPQAPDGVVPEEPAAPKSPSGPRTPEQIAMEEWEKEESLRLVRREYVVAGLKYGAAIGAILMFAQDVAFSFLGELATTLGGGGSSGGFGSLVLGILISVLVGAAYGSVIGLFVAWRDGGALEGGIAGAVTLVVLFQVVARLNGMGNVALYSMSIANAILGGASGALIGFLTEMSIRR